MLDVIAVTTATVVSMAPSTLVARVQAGTVLVHTLALVGLAAVGTLSPELPTMRRVAVVLLGCAAAAAWWSTRRAGGWWLPLLAAEVVAVSQVAVQVDLGLVTVLPLLLGVAVHAQLRGRLRAFLGIAFYAMAAAAAAWWGLNASSSAVRVAALCAWVLLVFAVGLVSRRSVAWLVAHDQNAARGRILATASAAFVAAEQRPAMLSALLGGVVEAVAEEAALVRVVTAEHDRLLAWRVGAVDEPLPLRAADLPAGVRRLLAEGRCATVDPPDVVRLATLLGANPTAVCAEWVAFADPGAIGAVVLLSPAPLSAATIETATLLASQAGRGLARISAREVLERAQRRFRGLVEHATVAITIVDAGGTIRYANPTIERLLGFPTHEAVGCRFLDALHPSELDLAAAAIARLQAQPSHQMARFECRLRARDGSWVAVEVLGNNLSDDVDVGGVVLHLRDLRERVDLERKLDHVAFHDELTGLANRSLLLNRIAHALERSSRFGEPVSVLVVDIDGFKGINGRFGNDGGDRLLVGLAERLRACVRAGDTLARVDGDEFAILLSGPHTPDDVMRLGAAVTTALETPFMIRGSSVSVRASIGIAAAGGGSPPRIGKPLLRKPGDVLREAQVAMHAAKRNGRGRIETFEPSMHAAVVSRLELEEDLGHAVERSQLRLVYQPILELQRDIHPGGFRTYGVEALLRWQHPTRGLLSPNTFIPAAEESGSILTIGGWTLREACREAVVLAGQGLGDLEMAVNLSGRQLDDPLFLDEVKAALNSTGLDPARLLLEITESAIMQNIEGAVARLRQLKGLGVRVAVDDFGTGYSSLAYLRRFPIDLLKIDKSFVDGIAESGEDAALVATILQLCASLGLDAVAEGIERRDQLNVLIDLGCRLGQGYLFSTPVDAAAVRFAISSRRGTAEPVE